MADLHHGLFSYSTGPTARDLLPTSIEDTEFSKGATKKFKDLSVIFTEKLRHGHEISYEAGSTGTITANKARDSALPRLSFASIHALALNLKPFEEEPSRALVFGNVSSENYIDMFWDTVNKYGEEKPGELVVYEAEQSSEPKFLVSFRDQLFELRYIRCDVLVREYPNISDASDEFLEDPENGIPKAVQDVVKMIRRGSEILRILDQHPEIREAYSLLKRWIAVRGLTASLPDNQIFKLLLERQQEYTDPADKHTTIEAARLITKFFEHLPKSTMAGLLPWNLEAFTYDDWITNMTNYMDLPIKQKLQCTHTIRAMVTYSGLSQMKGAQWLLMVQRKLVRLKDRLERSLPKHANFCITVWPYRLVEPDATSTDTVYEGNFVLGLGLISRLQKDDLDTVKQVSEAWREQTEKDRATIKDHCFIRFSYDPLPPLKICERKWPRLVLTGDNINDSDNDSSSDLPIKATKQQTHPSTPSQDKAPRFRTAAEVLNRLKHDSSYNLDDFVIGYLDRVKERILEKAAADWDRETTAEEFIPEHRIEYFKTYKGSGREGEVVWMKKGKIDKIFG